MESVKTILQTVRTAVIDTKSTPGDSIALISSTGRAIDPLKVRNSLLLVDDDFIDRKSIRRLLNTRDHGFEIDEAVSKQEALELCNKKSYDCILLDFRLGEDDALDLLPKLKQSSADGRLAIVLVTGMGNEYLAAQAFKAGVHDYVVKSNLRADTLFGAVEHAMQSINLERENEKQRHELEFYGLHDHLTELPNRKLFFDRLEQAVLYAERGNANFSVCSMDLNRFKEINDTLGHEAGDQVLVEVASRLSNCLRSSDTVARIGGDEFVALLNIAETEGVAAVVDKLIKVVSEPISIGELQVSVGLSIGISSYTSDCGTAKDLLKQADAAMYEAKKGSRGAVWHTDDTGINDDFRVVAIATEISGIVENEALEIEYQPKINLQTYEIVGVEALVRWRHPSLGLLPPVEFIPVVERTQKIKPVTYFIAEMAIKQCASWLGHGIEVPIAVNLSAKILDNADLPAKIEMLLKKWQLPPGMLTLEVTETGALASQKVAANILFDLASLGVQISIDDFGSGFTSFRYLRDFTIHELKIDQMFVDDLVKGKRDESIIKSMLELGKGFGVKVVAEGIEDETTLEKLKALNCEYGQGFLFSGAMRPNQFVVWASEWAIKCRSSSTKAPWLD